MTDCIFCKIINKEIPSDFVFEDDEMVVFRDIKPKAKYHFLVVPKKHFTSLNKIDDSNLLGKLVYKAKDLAKEFNFAESGYNVVVNTGEDGGQIVKHLHVHVLGGESLRGLV